MRRGRMLSGDAVCVECGAGIRAERSAGCAHAADKAVENLLVRNNRHRGLVVVMKRAKPLEFLAGSLKVSGEPIAD